MLCSLLFTDNSTGLRCPNPIRVMFVCVCVCVTVPGKLVDENLDDLGHFPVRADKCSALSGKMSLSTAQTTHVNTHTHTLKCI